ncbi:MAG: hypothetical protein ACLQUZ_15655 [Rhizomicrobium sp.]
MRSFTMVSPMIWLSARFRKLPDDAKLLFLYLLSCPHQNSAGVFRLTAGYACDDLTPWDSEKFQRSKNALVKAGMVQVDDATEEILIELWFKHSPPTSGATYIGIEKQIRSIVSQRLREAAMEALEQTWNPNWRGPKRLSNASPQDDANSPRGLVTSLQTRLNTNK